VFVGHTDKILVCITPQSNSRRLIYCGYERARDSNGYLAILNVERGQSICTKPESAEILQQLFDYAAECGATVHALCSNDVAETIIKFIRNERITHLILGEHSREYSGEGSSVITQISERLPHIGIEVLPREDNE